MPRQTLPPHLYIYIQFFFLINIYQPEHGNIYIYIYVAIGGKTERLYFHPFKLISWKQACKDESIVSLFFPPITTYIMLYFYVLSTVKQNNQYTDFLFLSLTRYM